MISNAANQPVVLQDKKAYDESEMIEESLSIADKERELIIKSLRKHRNKRKDAASDLGIYSALIPGKLRNTELNYKAVRKGTRYEKYLFYSVPFLSHWFSANHYAMVYSFTGANIPTDIH